VFPFDYYCYPNSNVYLSKSSAPFAFIALRKRSWISDGPVTRSRSLEDNDSAERFGTGWTDPCWPLFMTPLARSAVSVGGGVWVI